ncbi:MAG TPA: hypothetical protein VFN22_00235 [Gemmatimonadales bacterium]|nr:hypothetical protein [Gemmatimonadales bacterium]
MTWSYPVTIDRCVCQRTLFRELLSEARAANWTLDALVQATGCGDQCGMCLPYLRRMLSEGTTVFHHVIDPEENST